VKNRLIFIDFFGKNGEEISYYTKSSLVIFVKKKDAVYRANFFKFDAGNFEKKTHICEF